MSLGLALRSGMSRRRRAAVAKLPWQRIRRGGPGFMAPEQPDRRGAGVLVRPRLVLAAVRCLVSPGVAMLGLRPDGRVVRLNGPQERRTRLDARLRQPRRKLLSTDGRC